MEPTRSFIQILTTPLSFKIGNNVIEQVLLEKSIQLPSKSLLAIEVNDKISTYLHPNIFAHDIVVFLPIVLLPSSQRLEILSPLSRNYYEL